MAKTEIKISKRILGLDKNVVKAARGGIEDCTDDLLRVATLRTPVDSQTLEQSGTSNISANKNNIVGKVSFSAMKKGFNYAKKMNEGSYNLGKKSLTKAARGVRSKFSQSTMKVGSGFLDDTANKCKKGYTEHINKKIKEGLR